MELDLLSPRCLYGVHMNDIIIIIVVVVVVVVGTCAVKLRVNP